MATRNTKRHKKEAEFRVPLCAFVANEARDDWLCREDAREASDGMRAKLTTDTGATCDERYGFAPSEIHFIIISASALGTFRGPLGIDPLATNEYRLLVKALPGWTALPLLMLE